VITLWSEVEHPAHRVWLGPLLAAAFLLRGMAVLMPLMLVVVVSVWRERGRSLWAPTLGAVALFALPVGAWVIARHHVDGWAFLERLFMYDFVARSLRTIEDHPGGPFYYLNILQKHHYDWLAAGMVTTVLFPLAWQQLRGATDWRARCGAAPLLVAWIAITLLV